jgi:hypothetical protein
MATSDNETHQTSERTQLTSRERDQSSAHSIPESFNAFRNIVSYTAVNINLMLLVSVTHVWLSELHY